MNRILDLLNNTDVSVEDVLYQYIKDNPEEFPEERIQNIILNLQNIKTLRHTICCCQDCIRYRPDKGYCERPGESPVARFPYDFCSHGMSRKDWQRYCDDISKIK